ncbi:metallophosphoesterase family protein [Phyllobacterium endophyticum]|uniref:DNA repair exonuclease n=1 Tax=Phyllobacterium endophyticum TaxID=1149773 RepID=A0A2P7AS88_9HYPH|nr:DNA repair exonuclease [Phyllobacterium endophyticum]MBB3236824.1 DNA repair exonuclease SbcCD nuclease subunit [Phyllobacterium endophyticum]PSH57091.1 DNA repair exonuclease [Phyllobacterium endophyticum]TYR40369.1 DNA repair exonuclease [Phyllobacterium endophyticum]
MPFRFIHTADIHLDSPLRSLSLRDPDLAGLIGDATRQALIAIVDLCLEEQVHALIIAGDLYDGDQTSMKTARFLATQMERLHAAGISVYKIRGNHDALSKITQELVLPPSVKIFGSRAEAMELRHDGMNIVIHGLSFAKPHAPDSLLPKYRPPVADGINIGIMHTSLAGASGHDPYGPCNVADLHASDFDYWALGHIHQRSHHLGQRTVIMPGMPQGRDINEAGEKTVSLVTIGDDRSIVIEERLTSIAQFERLVVDVTDIQEWRDVISSIENALVKQRDRTRSEHLVGRLKLIGNTRLAWRLRRDLDLLQAEADQRAQGIGRTWVEKIDLSVRPADLLQTFAVADPLIELGELMQTEVMTSHGFREDIRQMVQELLDDLPAESRKFAGNNELEFDVFIDDLMVQSGDDIIARLQAPAREPK